MGDVQVGSDSAEALVLSQSFLNAGLVRVDHRLVPRPHAQVDRRWIVLSIAQDAREVDRIRIWSLTCCLKITSIIVLVVVVLEAGQTQLSNVLIDSLLRVYGDL